MLKFLIFIDFFRIAEEFFQVGRLFFQAGPLDHPGADMFGDPAKFVGRHALRHQNLCIGQYFLRLGVNAAIGQHRLHSELHDLPHVRFKFVLQFAKTAEASLGSQRFVIQFFRFQRIVDDQDGRLFDSLRHFLAHPLFIDNNAHKHFIPGIFFRHDDFRQLVVRLQ